MHLFGVKNAFMHENLEEDLYIKIPLGYDTIKGKYKVCRLRKPLYGPKHLWDWFESFTHVNDL